MDSGFMPKCKRKNDSSGAPDPAGACNSTGSEATLTPSADAARLRAENDVLRKELSEVLANAAENERIWRHFAAVERLLFRMRELDRLAEELLHEISVRFQAEVLVLYVSHPEIQERLFQQEPEKSFRIGDIGWISPMAGEEVRSLFSPALKPVLFSAGKNGPPPILTGYCGAVRSGALIPLNVNEVLFGALLLGSPDPDRYRPQDGTDLLERLGTHIALSLDNCLTYEKVKDFAVQDHLTGLLNFFQIYTVLEREFRKARRLRKPISVLVVDFSFVHDWDEFEDGQEVLKHAASQLEKILPPDDCFIGRYGSDEFLAVLPNVPEEEAREVIPYLSSTIRKSPFKYGNTAVLITTEIGVGSFSEGMACAQDLVDAAYAELCTVKGRRKNND